MGTKNTQRGDLRDTSFENTFAEIMELMSFDVRKIRKRFEHLLNALDSEFPKSDVSRRAASEAISWAMMDIPLTLYAINMTGAAIVEIYGILEKSALQLVAKTIAKRVHEDILYQVFQRRNLSDHAKMLHKLNVIDKEDLKFLEKISALRNAVAHKNPKIISILLKNGKPIHSLDIDSEIRKVEFIPIFVNSLRIHYKLFKYDISGKKKSL